MDLARGMARINNAFSVNVIVVLANGVLGLYRGAVEAPQDEHLQRLRTWPWELGKNSASVPGTRSAPH